MKINAKKLKKKAQKFKRKEEDRLIRHLLDKAQEDDRRKRKGKKGS